MTNPTTKIKWEVVEGHQSIPLTERLRVPNGWLYRCYNDEGLPCAPCFVPDVEPKTKTVYRSHPANLHIEQAFAVLWDMAKEGTVSIAISEDGHAAVTAADNQVFEGETLADAILASIPKGQWVVPPEKSERMVEKWNRTASDVRAAQACDDRDGYRKALDAILALCGHDPRAAECLNDPDFGETVRQAVATTLKVSQTP